MIEKIVSGGQTGADRAALDSAIKHGIPHGGWCAKGRRSEDAPFLNETAYRRHQNTTIESARGEMSVMPTPH